MTMSLVEHYFANLIRFDKDIPGEPNKNGLSQEVVDAINECYYYLANTLFISREDLDHYLKKYHDWDRSEEGWWNKDETKV